jgi:uncharacterized protein (TIGR02301 family)
MISRLVPVMILAASSMLATSSAQAQSPFEFLRQQRQKQQQPRRAPTPPPAATPAAPVPATPAPARTDRSTESTVPTAPAAAAPAAPTTTAARENTPPPPYERDVRRIGEILGALHYLRPLCGANDGLIWRDKMRDLIEAEGGPADRRERLAGAFNEGYNGFQLTYRTCTPSADLAVRRYLEEGAKLTREISARHAN